MSTTSFVKASLTANGGSNGLLTVASTAGFGVGATVYLSGTGLPTQTLVIAEITATGLYVRDPSVNGSYSYFNASAYTTAAASAVSQPAQDYFATTTAQLAAAAISMSNVGADEHVGTIVATTTAKSNSSTASTFPLTGGTYYSVQPDAECFVASGISDADAIAKLTAGKGVRVELNALYDRPLPKNHNTIAVVAIVGTVNAKVFQIIPVTTNA